MPADRLLHPRAGHSEKVSALSSDAYRVWTQYLLSADDFGVMRRSAITLRDQNQYLAGKSEKVVDAWLDVVVNAGLITPFEHQARWYVFQWDWQSWQKIEYPRATILPAPPAEFLARCDEPTRKLFELHPGGTGKKFRKRLEKIPEMQLESSDKSAGKSAATRETANGLRLTANGSLEESVRETTNPPMDEWARELVVLYPAQGRCKWNLVERPLYDVLSSYPDVSAWDAWEALKTRLDGHKRSHQWAMKGMIPRLDKWLREGLYLQELSEAAPGAEQVSQKTNRTLAAAAAIMRESA